MKLLSIIICLIFCKYADPFPDGAPVKHCGDMMPGHGVAPLSDPAPFEITYMPNNSTGVFDGIFTSKLFIYLLVILI